MAALPALKMRISQIGQLLGVFACRSTGVQKEDLARHPMLLLASLILLSMAGAVRIRS
jgi:hypothetical protein